jgi:hypothetical protein
MICREHKLSLGSEDIQGVQIRHFHFERDTRERTLWRAVKIFLHARHQAIWIRGSREQLANDGGIRFPTFRYVIRREVFLFTAKEPVSQVRDYARVQDAPQPESEFARVAPEFSDRFPAGLSCRFLYGDVPVVRKNSFRLFRSALSFCVADDIHSRVTPANAEWTCVHLPVTYARIAHRIFRIKC